MALSALAVFGGLACGGDVPETARAPRPAIYGRDGRVDAVSHPRRVLRDRAEASAVAIVRRASAGSLELGRWPDAGETLGAALGLCPGERFAEQPVLASCSGVVIGPQEILTARHCVPTPEVCEASLFVLGYSLGLDGALAPLDVDDVRRCGGLVAVGTAEGREGDFTVVRLDRPIAPHRAPIELRPADAGPLGPDEPVVVVGYPSGLPLKIDDGGRVLDGPPSRPNYQLSSDTFGGSSGSAVLDGAGRLVGIVAGGADDYADIDGCVRAIEYREDEGAEEAVSIEHVRAALDATEAASCACVPRVADRGPLALLVMWACVILRPRGLAPVARSPRSDGVGGARTSGNSAPSLRHEI
ncbi:serine protease [Myxococcota bacterium]|nr:serine protease [Myxococcota bacterium]